LRTVVKLLPVFLLLPPDFFASAGFAAEERAKQSQNPVDNVISLLIELHHDDGIGDDATVNALFLKPVNPVKLGNFDLINRAIIPVFDLDAGTGGFDYDGSEPLANDKPESGLGNIQFALKFLFPK
jgi:hypothetical protein